MAIERIIDIIVNETGADVAEKSVRSLESSIESLETETGNLSGSLDSNKQSLLDNGGAMGLLNELTGGYAMTAKDAVEASALFTKQSIVGQAAIKLYTFATTGATVATRALRIALISTGIGAIVVGIIALIVAVNEYANSTEDAEEKQSRWNIELEASIRFSKQLAEELDVATKIQIARAKEKGVSESELRKIETDAHFERLRQISAENDALFDAFISEKMRGEAAETNIKRRQELQAEFNKLFSENLIRQAELRAEDAQKQRDLDKENAEKSLEEQKKASEKRKKLLEEEIERRKQLEKDYQDFIFNMNQSSFNAEIDIYLQKEALLRTLRGETALTILEEERKNAMNLLELAGENAAVRVDVESQFEAKRLEIIKKQEEEELARIREFNQNKNDVQFGLANSLIGLLAQVGEKNKTLQKAAVIAESAAGIARIIVNTSVANAKAVAAFPLSAGAPFVAINSITAAASIASSILATQKALSQIGGGGSSSAPSPSRLSSASGGSESQAPQFNIVGQNSNNQLAGTIANQQRQPIETYVVGNQVTTQQALDRNRIQTALFN